MKILESQYENSINAYVVGDEPMVFHCHHYNVYLQNTIEDASDYFDAQKVLCQAAEVSLYHQWKTLTQNQEPTVELYQRTFSKFGFGIIKVIDFQENGGLVQITSDHYGLSYISKCLQRNPSSPSVSYFSVGFIAAMFAIHFQKPLHSYEVIQTKCFSKGDEFAEFQVNLKSEPEKRLYPYHCGRGIYGKIPEFKNPEGTTVDYLAIRSALTSMKLEGSPETGLIDAFGVLLTRHYANYYCNITFALLSALNEQLGEENAYDLTRELLVEAGHICAFNTMGGIMLSNEWNNLILPMIKNREDWLHGIIACINALGWGTYIIEEIVPYQSVKVKVYNDYEANHYLMVSDKKFHKPISFLAVGVIAGLMNLIYHADITQKPILNESFYNSIFKTKGRFIANQLKCRALGDEYALIEATKS